MNGHLDGVTTSLLDFDPATLSEAAYQVLLDYGLGDNWLQIKLALWHAMTDQVCNSRQTTLDLEPTQKRRDGLPENLI